jgi:hypothetical protein
MSTYPSSEGVIIYQGTNNRIKNAVILASKVDSTGATHPEPEAFQSNEDGIFKIADSDKPWKIEILHKDIIPFTSGWEPDGKRKEFQVTAINSSNKRGRWFFGLMIILLGLLLPVYLLLHYKVEKAGGPLSNLLVQKITEVQHQFADIQKLEKDFIDQIERAARESILDQDSTKRPDFVKIIKNGGVDSVNAYLKLIPTPPAPAKKARIDSLKTMGKNLESLMNSQVALVTNIDTLVTYLLRKDIYLMQADKESIKSVSQLLNKATLANDKTLEKKHTNDLLKMVSAPPWPGFIPWRNEPWRFFDILFWALAGVLVQKIITTGVYLWKDTFQNKGIWMHIAHLVVVPLLVLVTMMLLSMFSFAFSGSAGGSVVIDIADPAITHAFSFILAVAPWGVWDFIRAQSARITAKHDEG